MKIVILTTSCNEQGLFLFFLGRGRHAEISYYYSVEGFSWEDGRIAFTILNREVASPFTVGLSGNQVLVPVGWEHTVREWLQRHWQLSIISSETRIFETSEEVVAFLKQLRGDSGTPEQRLITKEAIKTCLRQRLDSEAKALLAMDEENLKRQEVRAQRQAVLVEGEELLALAT